MPLELVANLWTLTGHPARRREWTVEEKIRAVAEAGFAAVTGALDEDAVTCAGECGLRPVGWFWAMDSKSIREGIRSLSTLGIRDATIFLGTHEMTTDRAVRLARELHERASRAGIYYAAETHRDTATESPEKTAAILRAFRQATGRDMPVTWDFSHHALVKHPRPEDWMGRLVEPFAPAVVAAGLFHFRPFNGHHAQIPVRVAGRRTPEMVTFLKFAEAVMRLWRSAPGNRERTMRVCPEVGPVADGYALSHDMASWDQAVVLAADLRDAWRKAGK